MAAVLAFAVDAGDLALDVQCRPAFAPQQPTHRLVERAVAVVVLAALDVARRGRDPTLATIKFAWADDKPGEVTIKPVSTILVGATPEFEIAALSLAFLCGEQEGDNRTEAVWKSTSELGYNVASMAWGGRTLIST